MRAKTKLFTLAGKQILVPDAGVQATVTDVVGDSVRDRSGMLHRTVLRRVRGWTFRYSQLTNAEREYLLSILPAGTFQFVHPEGKCTAYCQELTSLLQDGNSGIWEDVRFRVEEV